MKGTVTLDITDYNALMETVNGLKAKVQDSEQMAKEFYNDCNFQSQRIELLEIAICQSCIYDVRTLYPTQEIEYKTYMIHVMDKYGISEAVRQKALEAYLIDNPKTNPV